MGFQLQTLWQKPQVNPINGKARTIPVLNPLDKHGRVFFFSWLGFMFAFLSWYAFPPLLTHTIKKDLHLSQNEVANSNIVALTATLLVRLVAGPACDLYGPKITFVACLLLGAIPSALAGTVTSAAGLITLRFFVGILGGSFVPCQVWTTAFFDKNIIGTANALTAGWGNSGGGITYFVMPAILDSLVAHYDLTPHVAWRVSFVVPFGLITLVALGMLILCDDCPAGKWSQRDKIIQQQAPAVRHVASDSVQSNKTDQELGLSAMQDGKNSVVGLVEEGPFSDAETDSDQLDLAKHEVVQKPTLNEVMQVVFSPQTIVLGCCYLCSFGSELAINSTLGAYYFKNFKTLGQTGTGRWAAMFGLLNVVTRPLGGIFADLLYKKTGNAYVKKIWLHGLSIMMGVFLIIIGVLDSKSSSVMFTLVALMAVFLEASNGANFSLVPHVHPYANGVVSGITGAAGNLGGVLFAIVFRYLGTDFGKAFWIIGTICIGLNLAVCWIQPIPPKQIGGR